MRDLGIILAGTLGAGLAMGGPAGYLPRVGPVPLRFQMPRPVTRAELPPLQMQEPLPLLTGPPGAAASPPSEPGPAEPVSLTNELSTAPTNLPNQAWTNSPATGSDSKSEDVPVLTPQMFLRFFTPTGAGVGREVVVPFPPGFNPAQPGPSVSSSATYTSSKP